MSYFPNDFTLILGFTFIKAFNNSWLVQSLALCGVDWLAKPACVRTPRLALSGLWVQSQPFELWKWHLTAHPHKSYILISHGSMQVKTPCYSKMDYICEHPWLWKCHKTIPQSITIVWVMQTIQVDLYSCSYREKQLSSINRTQKRLLLRRQKKWLYIFSKSNKTGASSSVFKTILCSSQPSGPLEIIFSLKHSTALQSWRGKGWKGFIN